MKIYKENIKRIIQILDEKYKELEDGEYFEFKDNKLVKKNYPINFFIEVTDDNIKYIKSVKWITENKGFEVGYRYGKTCYGTIPLNNSSYSGSRQDALKAGLPELTTEQFIDKYNLTK